jgi:argininosuccinate synthase
MSEIRKVVLAYSGGLDTSVILKWLQDTYGCEVITFTADIGQGEELEPARAKAQMLGVEKIYIEDLREEFVRDFVFPMFRANTVYEGEYLLGTSIARPLIAKRLVEIARREKADAISHGATGKGNDQVRFELGAYALMPNVKVIAPWREWDLLSREKLLAYADQHKIPVDFKKRKGGAPFSMDANLLHISYEGGVLEDPAAEPPAKGMWRLTVPVEKAPNKPEDVELEFVRGDLTAINGQKMKAHELLTELNRLGGKHGIGRLDLVENRYVGMKSRGCYETPGGTILLRAHRAIESLTLDREVAHLKDDLMPRYASMIYNGYWWSPERRALQVLIDHTQEPVSGTVVVRLYKGNVIVVSRKSENSLFDARISTFEDDAGAYDQADAGGFIKLNALRMRIAAGKEAGAKGTGRRKATGGASRGTASASVGPGTDSDTEPTSAAADDAVEVTNADLSAKPRSARRRRS